MRARGLAGDICSDFPRLEEKNTPGKGAADFCFFFFAVGWAITGHADIETCCARADVPPVEAEAETLKRAA
jgi:hypothetical protein